MSPQELWRVLAPAIASRPVMRLSGDGGRNYPGRLVRALSTERPAQPAAVATYDADGFTSCFVADLDVGKAGQAQVDADARGLLALVEGCGGRAVLDRSPSGGVHLYVPLTEAVHHAEARPLAASLAAVFPSLDPGPMLSTRSGCVRPPGSWHKARGGHAGHQELVTPFRDALGVFSTRNGPQVWSGLVAAVRGAVRGSGPAPVTPPPPPDPGGDGLITRARAAFAGGARRPLSGTYARLGLTGETDPGRYKSPSEARQGLVAALYWRGHTYDGVLRDLDRGSLPGLARLYGRASTPLPRLLAHEWLVAARGGPPGRTISSQDVHHSPTRVLTTRGGSWDPSVIITRSDQGDVEDRYGWIRTWLNAVLLEERAGRMTGTGGQSARLVLHALGWASQCAGEFEVEFGTRALGLCSLRDATTVAAALRQLEAPADHDPFIVRVNDARGVHATRYRLRIPDRLYDAASRMRWRTGSCTALHPTFRILGAVAGLVYDVLDTIGSPRTEVAHTAAVSDRAAHTALHLLAEHGLAERSPGRGWRRGPVAPGAVAEQLGATAAHTAVADRYRAERAAWHRRLGAGPAVMIRQRSQAAANLTTGDAPTTRTQAVGDPGVVIGPDEEQLWAVRMAAGPPPEEERPQPRREEGDTHSINLLQAVLGAVVIKGSNLHTGPHT